VSGRATEGERVAMSALLVEAGAHERTKREHKDRLERLVDAAHAEADERDWCFEFDDFLEAQGLPRRSHDYQLRVEVTATVYVSRDATSEDNAIDSLTTQEVFDLLTVQNIDYEASEDYREALKGPAGLTSAGPLTLGCPSPSPKGTPCRLVQCLEGS
jgi:hypothetical protein